MCWAPVWEASLEVALKGQAWGWGRACMLIYKNILEKLGRCVIENAFVLKSKMC